jgi:hypothetical protein
VILADIFIRVKVLSGALSILLTSDHPSPRVTVHVDHYEYARLVLEVVESLSRHKLHGHFRASGGR